MEVRVAYSAQIQCLRCSRSNAKRPQIQKKLLKKDRQDEIMNLTKVLLRFQFYLQLQPVELVAFNLRKQDAPITLSYIKELARSPLIWFKTEINKNIENNWNWVIFSVWRLVVFFLFAFLPKLNRPSWVKSHQPTLIKYFFCFENSVKLCCEILLSWKIKLNFRWACLRFQRLELAQKCRTWMQLRT